MVSPTRATAGDFWLRRMPLAVNAGHVAGSVSWSPREGGLAIEESSSLRMRMLMSEPKKESVGSLLTKKARSAFEYEGTGGPKASARFVLVPGAPFLRSGGSASSMERRISWALQSYAHTASSVMPEQSPP